MSEPAPASEPKLTPAELKAKKQEEKKARRAAQIDQREGGATPSTSASPGVNGAGQPGTTHQGTQLAPARDKGGERPAKGQQQQKQQQKQPKSSAHSGEQQAMPIRRRLSQAENVPRPTTKKDKKEVDLVSHLYTQPRRHTLEGASSHIHPTIQRFGLQMRAYEICGSSARCVGMLEALKDVIQAYNTPVGSALAHHFPQVYLPPQIDFLKSCRPLSQSMGNAIRWLKQTIGTIDPSVSDQDAKNDLCEKIDTFIRERIVICDQVIAESARSTIKNGSVVLTFAKSSIVEKTILEAHRRATRFRVIIIDSRPLHEGKSLARSLMYAGLNVEIIPFSGIAHAVKQATLVLLGAHSMVSTGGLRSRIGTAALAMQAAKADIPVIVLCESIKFSDKAALGSIAVNEVAPAEELLLPKQSGGDDEGEAEKLKSLHSWRDIPNLQMLNLMYDVTPAKNISVVICEYGSIGPQSVQAVHAIANGNGAE